MLQNVSSTIIFYNHIGRSVLHPQFREKKVGKKGNVKLAITLSVRIASYIKPFVFFFFFFFFFFIIIILH